MVRFRRPIPETFTPEGRGRKYRSRKLLAALAVLVVGGLLAVADRAGWFGHAAKGGDWETYQNVTARVVHVTDGDTLDVDIPDRVTGKPRTRIRLWGVDTPCNSLNAAIRRAFWAKFAA